MLHAFACVTAKLADQRDSPLVAVQSYRRSLRAPTAAFRNASALILLNFNDSLAESRQFSLCGLTLSFGAAGAERKPSQPR